MLRWRYSGSHLTPLEFEAKLTWQGGFSSYVGAVSPLVQAYRVVIT
ncbi:hypothetical protein DGo_PB0147 (plasmid) [Deinococcus gobiensis I-0]|uniref:Uncharacterized protein n=1 Tax=Deinococcus gobiensis (strain DSM 21396 / JCM 16679 / CGMCC 1.7299 / I-0) TaxID=745776 RepID=H8H1L9_DEIGI|nr:hypothetical protein DGo_PB0147 [Deinococcus gobiensis I-0]